MADISLCDFCNKLFQSYGGKICPDCHDEIDRDFITIRDYIYDNPGVFDIDKISGATEVKKKKILYLIEEKRLILDMPEGQGAFSCSVCHKPIQHGSMCDNCRELISNTIEGATNPHTPEDKKPLTKTRAGGKMHLREKE